MHENEPRPLNLLRDAARAQRPRLLTCAIDMTSSSDSAPPPPPPPDPVYTFRPYAGEVTAVQYITLPGRQPAIASG